MINLDAYNIFLHGLHFYSNYTRGICLLQLLAHACASHTFWPMPKVVVPQKLKRPLHPSYSSCSVPVPIPINFVQDYVLILSSNHLPVCAFVVCTSVPMHQADVPFNNLSINMSVDICCLNCISNDACDFIALCPYTGYASNSRHWWLNLNQWS